MKTPNIHTDIEEKRYVVFSIQQSKQLNYYPGVFNSYPGVSLKELKIYDLITIKVYITDGNSDLPQIIDDYINLTINSISDGKVIAQVLTKLPEDFHFKTGSSVEILEEEILYHVPVGDSLKNRTVN